jgi:serine protease Do
VVAITNTATYNYNFGFYSYEDEVKGSGSGIVIGKNETELLIVTNYHVIEGANSLTVTFVDGETVQAYTKGTAPDNDLAVVAVMLKDMKAETKAAITIASLGSEKEVEVGHKVVAIGNALGYGQVLTVGYVSAVNREVKIENKVLTLIQTDAAINPGNSGGALLNMNGEVIGINSAKYSDTNVEGMGFAIPISLVREIIDDLMTRETLIKVGKDEKGYIGVGLQTSSGSAYGMPNGAYVTTVIENGPAVNSGLLPGDIITKLEDISIATREDLLDALDYYKGGTTVNLTVQRRVDGTFQEMQIQVTLGYRKDYVKE